MKRRIILPLIIFLMVFPSISVSREISYSQDDRERLIRVEEGLKTVNQRIDGLQNLLYIVIGAIFAQIVGVVGFVLWDRRTALAPAIKKNKELEE